jgi:hypothetical protein
MSDHHDKVEVSPAARKFIIGLCVLAAILVALEFIIHRHAYFATEGQPLFFAVYGFVAFIIVVAGGVGLRKLVMRDVDYYTDSYEQGEQDD